MAVAANKRSVMTLFSGPTDIFSHQVRIVLAEKGVSVEIEQVEPDNLPQDLIDLNPIPDGTDAGRSRADAV
ncbi:Stringent starvation protein A [Serratia fonticola]|uniref:Stringent starvation protein A n=1 Tax=Serratia fonticola TaxID=47917 RepID=A0A4U9W8R3_SERFO|nr:Stringent starvation protein A [Serratia fonticola]